MKVPLAALVVDDEPDIQLLFKQRFRKELRTGQLYFHFACSGKEALDYLRDGGAADIVLVLSDINMPGMSGLELLKRIKAEYPGLEVVMLTAYNDAHMYQTAMKYGARDYITKPIDFEALKEKMAGL